MKTVEIGIYTFDELSEDAKERARDWYRESDEFNPEFEQFETAAKILGIEFDTRPITLMSGKTLYESHIMYSGFFFAGGRRKFHRNLFPETFLNCY